MKIIFAVFLVLVAASISSAQNCSSWVSPSDGWKPVKTAPRDGTVVEMAETFGIAPWFGLFKWTGTEWRSAQQENTGVVEDTCLFWRPYKGTVKNYADPTGGKQDSVKYWCDAMHMPYDAKKDRCIAPATKKR